MNYIVNATIEVKIEVEVEVENFEGIEARVNDKLYNLRISPYHLSGDSVTDYKVKSIDNWDRQS